MNDNPDRNFVDPNNFNEEAADQTPLRNAPQSAANEPESYRSDAANPAPATQPQSVAATDNAQPAATNQPAYQQPASQIQGSGPVQPEKKSNKMKLIIAAAVGLFVVIAAILTYFLWYQKPEKVVSDALGSFIAAKDMTFTGSMSIESQTNKLSMDMDGASSGKNAELNADVTVKMSGSNQKLNVPFSLVGTTDTFYIKASKLKDLEANLITPYLTSAGMPSAQQAEVSKLIASIDGQWYKVTADDLNSDSADSKKKSECVANQLDKIRSDKTTQNELSNVYKNHHIFKVVKSLGMKDGSVGYELEKSSDSELNAFGKAFKATQFFKDLQKCDNSIKFDEGDLKSKSSSEPKTTFELWANQFTHKLTKLSASAEGKDSQSDMKAKMIFEPNIGEKKDIKTPSGAKTVDQLKQQITDLTNSFMGGSAQMDESSAAGAAAGSAMQVRASVSSAKTLAESVRKKAEAYYAIAGEYPASIADFAMMDESKLEDASVVIATLPQDEIKVAYQRCDPEAASIVFKSLAANTYEALPAGEGPSGTVTALC